MATIDGQSGAVQPMVGIERINSQALNTPAYSLRITRREGSDPRCF